MAIPTLIVLIFLTLFQVAVRLFPFSRGLFEDKVANLWFCADVVFKLRKRLAVPHLAKLALVSTLRCRSSGQNEISRVSRLEAGDTPQPSVRVSERWLAHLAQLRCSSIIQD